MTGPDQSGEERRARSRSPVSMPCVRRLRRFVTGSGPGPPPSISPERVLVDRGFRRDLRPEGVPLRRE
eukprot:12613374-Alexandrium_andersonii.AAC.1